MARELKFHAPTEPASKPKASPPAKLAQLTTKHPNKLGKTGQNSLREANPLPAQGSNHGLQPQFEFINGLTSKNVSERKKSRAFVTRQYYRKKRHEAAENAIGVFDVSGPGVLSQESTTLNSDLESGGESTSHFRASATASGSYPNTNQQLSVLRLGGTRTEPFNSWPVEATRDIQELADHFYFVIPSLLHRHWGRSIRRTRSAWDLFNLYRKDALPFLGMLHHAAHHLAGLHGWTASVSTLEFKERTIQAVNTRLSTLDGPCDDATLIGIGLLANVERMYGDRSTARLHWGALKRLLLARGGFPSLLGDPVLHTKLVWSFIAFSWPTGEGSPAYIDGFSEAAVGLQNQGAAGPYSAFLQSCSEFTQFFAERRKHVLANVPSNWEQQKRVYKFRFRRTLFQPQGKLSSALDIFEAGYAHSDKRRSLDNCLMACLIHLNLVLSEYGDFSASTESYLEALAQILEYDGDDSDLTAEHLLWTLLTAFKPVGHYERVWKLCRLIGVVKHGSLKSWQVVQRSLRVFLKMPESAQEIEHTLEDWDQKLFWTEVDKMGSGLALRDTEPTVKTQARSLHV